jgi:hypothetical protein
MSKFVPARSPQFRVSLMRKLGNLAPGCKVEFIEDVAWGVGFRLKDARGRYRSNVVKIHRSGPHVLDAEALVRAIRGAGIPDAGFPRGARFKGGT